MSPITKLMIVAILAFIVFVSAILWDTFHHPAEVNDTYEYDEDIPDQTELEDDDYDDEDEEEYEHDLAESAETAVDIADTVIRMSRKDWISEMERYRIMHTEQHPELYDDDWYENCRRQLSAWKIEQDLDARKYQKRAGITVRGIAA